MFQDMWSLISFVIIGALIDSIDPCIYTLYIALLVPTAINFRRCVNVAVAFITSVYIGYLLFNAILRLVLLISSPPQWILSAILIAYALSVLTYSIIFDRGRYNDVCREDRLLCRFINRIGLSIESADIVWIAVLGLISSFTVLPCSAGMAIAFNIVTKGFGLGFWVPLAMLYTTIFVLPLIALTLIVIGITKIHNLYNTMLRKQLWIKIGGAVVMIAVALWLLRT